MRYNFINSDQLAQQVVQYTLRLMGCPIPKLAKSSTPSPSVSC